MGRMKDLYTEMHEEADEQRGIPQEIKDVLLAHYGGDPRPLGDIASLKPELISLIQRGADDTFNEAVQQKFQHAKSVLLQKHKDYGPLNIALAPGGAINGIRVRMWDKIARINHLLETGADPQNESLKDSFLDLANYAIIAMMVLDDEWPSE
jgi:hypothetical protein